MWRQWRSGIHEQRHFCPGPDPWIPGGDIHRSISVIKIVHSFKGMNRTEVSCWVKFAFRQAGLVSKISLKSTVTVIILSVKGLHLISKIREYHIIWCPYNGLYCWSKKTLKRNKNQILNLFRCNWIISSKKNSSSWLDKTDVTDTLIKWFSYIRMCFSFVCEAHFIETSSCKVSLVLLSLALTSTAYDGVIVSRYIWFATFNIVWLSW